MKSTQFIHVAGMREAWSTAYDLARDVLRGLGVSLVHFAYDADASKAAGYAIYRAAPDCDGLPVMLHYNYICDLGDALELNTCRGDWSGVVYRIVYAGAAAAPAAVSDGDGLQAAAVPSPVQSSAAAGAIPAEGSPVAGTDSVQGSETGAAAPAVQVADGPGAAGFVWDDNGDPVREVPATDPRPACWVISDGLEGDERVQVDMVSRKDGFIRSFDTLAGFLREWSWFYSCGVGVMDDDKLAAALQYVTEAGHGARASVLDAGFEIVFTFYRWAGYDRFMNRVVNGEVA